MQENKLGDYLDSFKPIVSKWPKIIISITLFFIIVISGYTATKSTNPILSDYLVNLSAGSIGSLITVFLIDYLINIERKSKLMAVNKANHYGLLFATRRLMIKIMYNYGYILKKDRFNYIDTAEEKFETFITDQLVLDKLESLSKLTKTTLHFLTKTNKSLEKGIADINKALSELKPFPDPAIKYMLSVESSFGAGGVSVGQDLLKFYFSQLPKKIDDQEIKKMQPGMKVLWKKVSEGISNPKLGFMAYYMSTFKALLMIARRAKEENAFFDL